MTPPASPVPDRADALAVVSQHLRDELGLDGRALGENDVLDLLPGADSIRLMRALAAIERSLAVTLDDNDVRRAVTVGDVVDALLSAMTARTWQREAP